MAMLSQLIFVRLGMETFPGDLTVLDSRQGFNQILAAADPPVEVWVSGEGFCPVQYALHPGGEVRASFQNGTFRLDISPRHTTRHLHLKALCGKTLPADTCAVSGVIRRLLWSQEEHPWFSEPTWEKLPEDLRPVITPMIQENNSPVLTGTARLSVKPCSALKAT